MAFVFINFRLIIRKPFKKFFRRFLKGKYDFVKIATCIISCVVVSKIVKSTICTIKSKSLRKMLNKIGPSINPWGTPESIFSQELYAGLF